LRTQCTYVNGKAPHTAPFLTFPCHHPSVFGYDSKSSGGDSGGGDSSGDSSGDSGDSSDNSDSSGNGNSDNSNRKYGSY